MKNSTNHIKLLLGALMANLCASSALAVPFSGNLSLGSQADVEAASIYTSVTGSLTISGVDIDDLGPLAGIESIGSYLGIDDNPALTVVADAFPALTEVGGGIYVYYNPNMVSVAGFDALLQTGDNIDFWFNDSLVSVSGFGALHTAGWSLEFGGNPVLTDLPSFDSLQTISSSLFILDNTSLTSITGFNALQWVDWSFQIGGNTSLDNLCGFYNYFLANNPYTGGGAFDIVDNGPALPNPTSIQDVLDAGPCTPLPDALIDSLIAEIEAAGLSNKNTRSLANPLDRAQRNFAKGRVQSALDQVASFVDQVASLEQNGELDGLTAADWIAAAAEIVDSINFHS